MRRRSAGRTGRRVRRGSAVFLRLIPGTTPIHRMWAGTKLVALAAVGLTLTFVPTWPAIAVVAGLMVVATVVARIPAGAVPRVPVWFWISLLAGAVLTLLAGGRPVVHVGTVRLGLGSLELFVRAVALGMVLLWGSALVAWTTALGDIGPAVSRLGAPLRRLHVPVDELAMTLGLCVRCLPLVADELRTVTAARRLRPRDRNRGSLNLPLDLADATLAVALRRAAELGEAITARGGPRLGPPTGPGPRRLDLAAGLAVAAACAAAAVLGG